MFAHQVDRRRFNTNEYRYKYTKSAISNAFEQSRHAACTTMYNDVPTNEHAARLYADSNARARPRRVDDRRCRRIWNEKHQIISSSAVGWQSTEKSLSAKMAAD